VNGGKICKTVRKADDFESPSRPNSGKAACLFEIAFVLVRFNHVASRIGCDAICGGENVGDAFQQVEGLVMVSGLESG
jgi:hypothetical protein